MNPWCIIALIALALWLTTLFIAPPEIVLYTLSTPKEDEPAILPCPCVAHPICRQYPPPPRTGVALEERVIQISRN